MEREIAKIYTDTIKNIEGLIGDLSNTLTVELNKERQTNSYVYAISENRLRRVIKKKSQNKFEQVMKEFSTAIKKIEKTNHDSFKYDNTVIDNLIDTIGESVSLQFNRMSNSVITLTRAEKVSIRRQSRKLRISLKDAHKHALSSGILVPKYHFRDKSGRQWNTTAYFTMLTNSAIYTAAREIIIEKAITAGKEKVEIIQTGEIITLEEYEDLKQKLFHPNSKKLLKLVEDQNGKKG